MRSWSAAIRMFLAVHRSMMRMHFLFSGKRLKQVRKNGPEQKGLFKELPPRIPATLFARSVFKQLSKLDVSLSNELVDEGVIARLSENLDAATAGKLLFELTSACRIAKIDSESALRRHAERVVDTAERFVQESGQ